MKLERYQLHHYKPLRLVKRMLANHAGRDFVVGDLHGCRDLLGRLLTSVAFDASRDRLFSVGDLIDRGHDSLGCLELLKHPWFHVVMGNHEQLLLNFFAPWILDGTPPNPYDDAGFGLMLNGGNWVLLEVDAAGCPRHALGNLLPMVAELPQIIVVGEGEDRFNIVHAELAKSGSGNGPVPVWTDAEVDALPEWADRGTDFPAFRWSRRNVGFAQQPGKNAPPPVSGLSETYCGHTVGNCVRTAFSHIYIDTGAFLSGRNDSSPGRYGLTLVDVKARRSLTLRDLYLEEREY